MQNKHIALDNPYDDIGFLFWQIMKTWQREKQQLLGEFGITSSQLEVLSAAYHLSLSPTELSKLNETEVTQIAISKSINVDPMTTSTVLRNLEKKTLVNRKPSKIDTRARVVEITPKGEVLLLDAMEKVDKSTSQIFKKVDGDILKEQLRILLKVLTELNN